ncbi:MAG: CpsB/CapC family capsule biosynthesis tyrosine phosphatase [Thermoguttaceae bacterium]|jgi:protein-tyrosine phosphatase
MKSLAYETLGLPQRQRLERFGVSRSVDLHCHCLPGLDDGPRTREEAILLCRKIVEDGVTTTIATPHQLGRYYRANSAVKVRQAVNELAAELARENIALEILPGADVRVDERVIELLDAGEVLTLADRGKYLLLELPHELFVEPQPLLTALIRRGIRPIMTHPERYPYLQGSLEIINHWVGQGAVIQITAGSLLGDFGPAAFEMAWEMTRCGLVGVVATDAHDHQRRAPRLSAAIARLWAEMGSQFARHVCLLNPLAVLDGQDIRSEVPR